MEKRNKATIHYSPLRYPGGKNCIFPFVAKLFYENDMVGASYAEPYAGGSGLALRLLFEGYVNHVYINDLDRSIYSFWVSILNRSVEFCEWLMEVDVSIDNWGKYKEIQQNSETTDSFELAKSTFFLNRTNVSGVIKGGVIGGREQKGKYKIDARFNKIDLCERIRKIAEMSDHITVSNNDGLEFINQMNRLRKEVFIYLDPPYYQKGADLYMNFYAADDHKRLSHHVRKMRKRWMVSYDNHDFILNLYSNLNKISYSLSQAASNRVGEEILVFSEGLHYMDSIRKLKTPVML